MNKWAGPMTSPAATPPRRPRGRPRSERCDEAILDAALRLLAEQGYSRMSMDGVAAAAGVSKPTIYLRYRGKADLVTQAMASLRSAGIPPLTGDLRADLVARLADTRAAIERVGMSVFGTCLIEERHTPELLALLRERNIAPRRAMLREALEAARERGEIAAGDADLTTAVMMMIGAYYAAALAGETLAPDWTERVVDAALRGLGRAGAAP
jgi:AcrR family transcriptional regulator